MRSAAQLVRLSTVPAQVVYRDPRYVSRVVYSPTVSALVERPLVYEERVVVPRPQEIVEYTEEVLHPVAQPGVYYQVPTVVRRRRGDTVQIDSPRRSQNAAEQTTALKTPSPKQRSASAVKRSPARPCLTTLVSTPEVVYRAGDGRLVRSPGVYYEPAAVHYGDTIYNQTFNYAEGTIQGVIPGSVLRGRVYEVPGAAGTRVVYGVPGERVEYVDYCV